jgi:5-methylcytosine-specific restriction endonuclease McrA
MAKDYAELLKDPRWQRKRLEVFNRDNWACRRCGDTVSILHIHHNYYKADTDPWDYPDDAMITVCELCHRKVEFVKWLTRKGRVLLTKDNFQLEDINSVFRLIDHQLMTNNHMESYVRYEEGMKALFEL